MFLVSTAPSTLISSPPPGAFSSTAGIEAYAKGYGLFAVVPGLHQVQYLGEFYHPCHGSKMQRCQAANIGPAQELYIK